jgi:hypothetical protein
LITAGESVPHILADVLRSEPDWNRLPENLDPRLKLVLERCLEKKVRNRYHSIADVRIDIEHLLSDPQGAPTRADTASAGPARSSVGPVAAAVVATAVVAGLVGWRLWPAPDRPITRFSVDLDGPLSLLDGSIALSPDGRRIVYATNGQLHTRRLDQDKATTMPGTEQASSPFFSPDGESVAFFTVNQLKTVGFSGELPRVVADIGGAPGLVGAWDRDGRIFFGRNGPFGLSRVPAVGGEPEPFAELGGYLDLDYPDVLPGGEWVLFTGDIDASDWSSSDIVAQNGTTGERKVVFKGGRFARYLPTGHLVFVRDATLYAVAFDAKRLEVIGPPVPVVQGVAGSEQSGVAQFVVASNGTLVYGPGQAVGDTGQSALVRVDLEGKVSPLATELRRYANPRVSPDGSRVAVAVTSAPGLRTSTRPRFNDPAPDPLSVARRRMSRAALGVAVPARQVRAGTLRRCARAA